MPHLPKNICFTFRYQAQVTNYSFEIVGLELADVSWCHRHRWRKCKQIKMPFDLLVSLVRKCTWDYFIFPKMKWEEKMLKKKQFWDYFRPLCSYWRFMTRSLVLINPIVRWATSNEIKLPWTQHWQLPLPSELMVTANKEAKHSP